MWTGWSCIPFSAKDIWLSKRSAASQREAAFYKWLIKLRNQSFDLYPQLLVSLLSLWNLVPNQHSDSTFPNIYIRSTVSINCSHHFEWRIIEGLVIAQATMHMWQCYFYLTRTHKKQEESRFELSMQTKENSRIRKFIVEWDRVYFHRMSKLFRFCEKTVQHIMVVNKMGIFQYVKPINSYNPFLKRKRSPENSSPSQFEWALRQYGRSRVQRSWLQGLFVSSVLNDDDGLGLE